jgi:pimeloyl-ACP methyl ester carboxylesterase
MTVMPSEQLFFFGPDSEQVFAAFHAPPGETRGVAVLLCNTWGHEEQSVYLGLREWARQLAAAGWPCMRFDHWGTGDSSGEMLAPTEVSRHVKTVGLALDELKALSGASRVVLLGVRAGAALAWLAAAARDDVVGMLAVAPVLKGRTYIRELKALQLAGEGGDAESAGWFQSGGYLMSPALRDDWQAVDLTKGPVPAVPHMLLLDRPDMPSSPAWVTKVREAGVRLEVQTPDGYAGLVADPHRVHTPQAMLDASLRWLQDVWGELPRGHLPSGPPRSLVNLKPSGTPVSERFLLGLGKGLGVLAEPLAGVSRSGHAVLLLNSGSTRRIGLSRMWVDLARRWGARSTVVLRMDLAGIGDADPYPGRDANMSYPHEASQDIRAAIDQLMAVDGVRQVHAIGLCSGAYHALRSARDGHPVASITLINPLVYLNAEGLIVEDDAPDPAYKLYGAVDRYKRALLNPSKWWKLLSGQVAVSQALSATTRRLGIMVRARLGRLRALVGLASANSLGQVLSQVMARGVKVNFIFAGDDPGLRMLTEQARDVVDKQRRLGNLTLQVVEGADHVFVDVVQRERLMALLEGIATSW